VSKKSRIPGSSAAIWAEFSVSPWLPAVKNWTFFSVLTPEEMQAGSEDNLAAARAMCFLGFSTTVSIVLGAGDESLRNVQLRMRVLTSGSLRE
jgi:hypothetical protein